MKLPPKIALLSCICLVLTVGAYCVFVPNRMDRARNADLLGDIGLNNLKMKIVVDERFSSINSETAYLKAIVDQANIVELKDILVDLKKNREAQSIITNMPSSIPNNKLWLPLGGKPYISGNFVKKSTYNWNISYLVKLGSRGKYSLYIYAVDSFDVRAS